MAPLVKFFQNEESLFETKVCVTAQHREILDQVLEFFEICPDYDLDVMRPNQNLFTLTSKIIESLKFVLEDFDPDFVFVHGDTTTSMVGALASFYHGAKTCHVEAGLRTNNKLSPYPEELNRQITGRISDYHFAPTEQAMNNLLKENVSIENILITGNTVIDALKFSVKKVQSIENKKINYLKKLIDNRDLILVTGHRRENHGEGFIKICEALKEIAIKKPETLIIYPVHPNPSVQGPVSQKLSDISNIELVDPLSYPDFIWLMNKAKIILTDSGGVQEEAPSLGKPVLVMRETTERPEAVKVGTVLLVGTNRDLIVNESLELLENNQKYRKMSELHNPYGDGNASDKIVEFIKSK